MLIVAPKASSPVPLDAGSVEMSSSGLSLIRVFCDKFCDQQLSMRRSVRRGPAPGRTYIPTVLAEHPPLIGNSHLLTGRSS